MSTNPNVSRLDALRTSTDLRPEERDVADEFVLRLRNGLPAHAAAKVAVTSAFDRFDNLAARFEASPLGLTPTEYGSLVFFSKVFADHDPSPLFLLLAFLVLDQRENPFLTGAPA